jgi:hypothetical protein
VEHSGISVQSDTTALYTCRSRRSATTDGYRRGKRCDFFLDTPTEVGLKHAQLIESIDVRSTDCRGTSVAFWGSRGTTGVSGGFHCEREPVLPSLSSARLSLTTHLCRSAAVSFVRLFPSEHAGGRRVPG